MKRISYIFFRIVVICISLIPFKLLYVLSDLLSLLLFRLLRYRRKVVRSNIEFCFTDISKKEVKEIENSFYKNFTDILLETLKAFSCKDAIITNRYKLINPEILDKYYEQNESVVLLSQHYNNWEWGGYSLGYQMNHHILTVVKNLSNPYINKYLKKKRTGFHVTLISSMIELSHQVNNQSKPAKAIFFLADQYPANTKRTHHVEFFGKACTFHSAPVDFAILNNINCLSIEVQRSKRGYYEIEIVPLSQSNQNNTANDILNAYVVNLENVIRRNPGAWMWTHKRFKESINYKKL